MVDTLRKLTYISQAAPSVTAETLHDIAAESYRWNALNGVTGLLLFNGQRFCQTIEGGDESIGLLLASLRRDRRHSDLDILEDRAVEQRSFGSWRMRPVYMATGEGENVDPVVLNHLKALDPDRKFWAA